MITDLDHIETLYEANGVLGGVYAEVAGNTYADYGAGSANAYALASGQTTRTLTNTSTIASLNPYSATTQSNATASAYANTGKTSAAATYYGSSYYTSFMGSSMTMNSSMTTTTYRNG